MALTALDANTALIVIDLQKGILAFPTIHPTAEVVARAAKLATAFRRHRLPVVLVTVAGAAPGRTGRPARIGQLPADWAELLPELDHQPTDLRATKRTWGAFASTDLEARLKHLGVTQVVIVGISTTSGVELTARQAYEAGFHVTLATDAMTDMDAEAHANSLERIFPKLGETGSADDIIALLDSTRGGK